jgi:hypothetical protein
LLIFPLAVGNFLIMCRNSWYIFTLYQFILIESLCVACLVNLCIVYFDTEKDTALVSCVGLTDRDPSMLLSGSHGGHSAVLSPEFLSFNSQGYICRFSLDTAYQIILTVR